MCIIYFSHSTVNLAFWQTAASIMLTDEFCAISVFHFRKTGGGGSLLLSNKLRSFRFRIIFKLQFPVALPLDAVCSV
jgi:hypothetical protein